MKSLREQPFRVLGRLIWLGFEFMLAAITSLRAGFRPRDASGLRMRAMWLHQTCRRFLPVFGIRSQIHGPVPRSGLLVCNHLSYLDILVLASCSPAVLVAKQEVRSWPVLGWFSRQAGTLFVRREKRGQVSEVAGEMERVLRQGILLILFPEGTSSGGETVLAFKSSLLEPVARQKHPLHVGLIQYELEDGDAAEEVCYWRDMTLVPHMINLLGKRSVRASVRFTEVTCCSTDRKELARQLHAEVLMLKQAAESGGITPSIRSGVGIVG